MGNDVTSGFRDITAPNLYGEKKIFSLLQTLFSCFLILFFFLPEISKSLGLARKTAKPNH